VSHYTDRAARADRLLPKSVGGVPRAARIQEIPESALEPTSPFIATAGSWARSGIPGSIGTSSYDAANQQLAFGTMTQTFDPNGNLLTQTDASGTTTYTSDARNRLVAISGPGVTGSFNYDALGRRISKTVNGQVTTFHYDGLDIVLELGGAGEANYLRTLAIDEALNRTDATGSVSYLADILGSTVALADANAGVTTEYTYEPFGATHVSGQPSINPFQFTGRENDGTGVYYYRARYYAPQLARFLSEDPRQGGLSYGSRHTYARNNPLLYVDPMGEQTKETRGLMAIKAIESPLLKAAAIGGIISTGLVQVGVGATTVAVGAASIPETGPAGVIVAAAGVTVAATGVAQIAGGIALIPYLFPGSPPPGGIPTNACLEDFPPIPPMPAP